SIRPFRRSMPSSSPERRPISPVSRPAATARCSEVPMVSARLLLLGSALCLSACATARYPAIRAVTSQPDAQVAPFDRAYADGKAQLAAGHPGLAIVAFE